MKTNKNIFWGKWHEKRMSTSCALVPEKPGLYAIGEVKRCAGLEIGREYIYIGQTKNLRQRLKEHGPTEEAKRDLRIYIQKHLSDIKCWYCEMPNNHLTEREKFLIKEIKPRFNTQHNRKGIT